MVEQSAPHRVFNWQRLEGGHTVTAVAFGGVLGSPAKDMHTDEPLGSLRA